MAARDYIIAFNNADTGLMSLRIPAWDDPTRVIADDDEFLAYLQTNRIPGGMSGGLVLLSDIPTDRYFREAWEWDDGVTVNMVKARGIQLDKIRVVRNLELAAKDITFMRAVEAGDTDAQATIGTEKQVLRDIPATFDITTDAGTPELLKAKWPSELPARE